MLKRARVGDSSSRCILPPELLEQVARWLIDCEDPRDLRTARLVCQSWRELVTRYGNTLVWCGRLWGHHLQNGDLLTWPRDDRFPLSLPPGFLAVVLRCETVRFTWHHLLPLARRVMEDSGHREEERRLWDEICERYPEEATLDVVNRLLMYDTDRSVTLYGMGTIVHSKPFHRHMLHRILQHWANGGALSL